MALTNNIRRRGGTYYGRIAVPVDLVAKIGRREIQQALGKVRDPAEARRKVTVWVQDKHEWFERLRRGAILTSEAIEQECQATARELLGFLTADRMALPQGALGRQTDTTEPPNPRLLGLEDSLDRFAEAIREDEFRPVLNEAAEITERLGVSAPEGTAEWGSYVAHFSLPMRKRTEWRSRGTAAT